MQLNKVLKGLLIAIPVMTLAACSSSSSVKDSGNEGNMNDNNNGSQTSNVSDSNENVDVGVMPKQETPEEIQIKKDMALRQNYTVYFEFDKSSVGYEFGEMLSAHARFLVKNPNQKVTVEGHCDERGTPEYNIALGERRAKSVVEYLTTLGVAKSQIKVVSYGEEKPVDKSRTEAGFAKNRRAILVY